MLGSMFGVDSDMSLRQLVAGSPWAGALAILGARSIRINSIGGSLPRRDFGANQLKTTSRSTPSNAFLRNALDPMLSAPVCLTRNSESATANPTRRPRVRISLERTAHQVGRPPAAPQRLGRQPSGRPDAAGHIEEALLSLATPGGAPALPGCPLVPPRAMAGFPGARGAAGRTRGGVGGLWAKARGGEKKIKHARRTSTGSALTQKSTYLPFFYFFDFFYCGFGCFSAWGTQKQRKNFFGNFLVMTQKVTS